MISLSLGKLWNRSAHRLIWGCHLFLTPYLSPAVGGSLHARLWSEAAGSYFLLKNICCHLEGRRCLSDPCVLSVSPGWPARPSSSSVLTRVQIKINGTLGLLCEGVSVVCVVSVAFLMFCNHRTLPHFLPFWAHVWVQLVGASGARFESLTQRPLDFALGQDSTGRCGKDCTLLEALLHNFINHMHVLFLMLFKEKEKIEL